MNIHEIRKELESIAGFFAHITLDSESQKAGLKRLNKLFAGLGIKVKVHFARNQFTIQSIGPLPYEEKSNVSAIMAHLCRIAHRKLDELKRVRDIEGGQL